MVFIITAKTPQETADQIVSYLRMKRDACEKRAGWTTSSDKKAAIAKASILSLCISDIAGADFQTMQTDTPKPKTAHEILGRKKTDIN